MGTGMRSMLHAQDQVRRTETSLLELHQLRYRLHAYGAEPEVEAQSTT